MSEINTEYDLELWRRCKDWSAKEEGKLFWAWLQVEMKRLHDGALNELSGNPIHDVIKTREMLAAERQTIYLSRFSDMIKSAIEQAEQEKRKTIDLVEL